MRLRKVVATLSVASVVGLRIDDDVGDGLRMYDDVDRTELDDAAQASTDDVLDLAYEASLAEQREAQAGVAQAREKVRQAREEEEAAERAAAQELELQQLKSNAASASAIGGAGALLEEDAPYQPMAAATGEATPDDIAEMAEKSANDAVATAEGNLKKAHQGSAAQADAQRGPASPEDSGQDTSFGYGEKQEEGEGEKKQGVEALLAEAVQEVKDVRAAAGRSNTSAAAAARALGKAEREVGEVEHQLLLRLSKGSLLDVASGVHERGDPYPPPLSRVDPYPPCERSGNKATGGDNEFGSRPPTDCTGETAKANSYELPAGPKERAELPTFMRASAKKNDTSGDSFLLFGSGVCEHNGDTNVLMSIRQDVSYDDCKRRCAGDTRCFSFTTRKVDGYCRMQSIQPTAVMMKEGFQGMQCWQKVLSPDRTEWLQAEQLSKAAEASGKKREEADAEFAKKGWDSEGVAPEGWFDGMWKAIK